jgi:hypothetical protein
VNLSAELSKQEYQALSNAERLALLLSKTERVVGKIAYGNTLHLVSMLARGLRARIDACQVPALKAAWAEALQPAYLASPAYSINVALPEIRGMLTAGLQAGVCTQAEHDFIIELASYDKQLFADATLKDVVNHFNPSLIGGAWHELPESASRQLNLKLNAKPPEQTYVVVQWQDGAGDWYHATALHGVEAVKAYYVQLPYDGEPRALRWRCDYNLDCVVSL